jgi:hypothetical protein
MKNNNVIQMKKYTLLDKSLSAIKDKSINLLVLKGETGWGKTKTTLDYSKKNEINYEYINNYATPLSFYKLLYKNRKKDVLIFDDLQSINDTKIMSMIKAVCWVSEDNKRIINYYSTSKILEKEGIPNSFEFDASIILIFNNSFAGFEPILDRGVCINFDFSFKEKIKILENFQKGAKIEDDVLKYIKKNCNQATKNLSIRTAVILSNLKRAGYDFKMFAQEILKTDNEIQELINMSAEDWCKNSHKHLATYYRKCKKHNLPTPIQQKRKELKNKKIHTFK